MESLKNRDRGRHHNKLFLCFWPAVDGGSIKAKKRKTKDAVIIEGGGCHRNKFDNKVSNPSMSVSSLSDQISEPPSNGDLCDSPRRKKDKSRFKRRVSRVIKAVLFDTALAKKIHERKSRNSFRSSSNLSGGCESLSSSVNGIQKVSSFTQFSEANDNQSSMDSSRDSSSSIFTSSTSTATTCSASLSSSRNSSINSNPRTLSDRKSPSFRDSKIKPVPKPEGRYYSSNIGLCLLLVCLLVLIMWGKVCAILCTSAWFFFAPRRFIICGVESPVNLVDVDSEEYKKRIIMEGLLERNRNR